MIRLLSKGIRVFTLTALTFSVFLAASQACADENRVKFGTIEQAKHITLQSRGTAGGVAGAAIGYNLGSGNSDSKKRRRAFIGGAIGTAAASDTRPGMEYAVKFVDGTTTTLVSDQVHLEIGQCVGVEFVGKSANIREQDPVACNPEFQETVESLQEELLEDAAECAAVKQEILDATTIEAVEIATAKARILCN